MALTLEQIEAATYLAEKGLLSDAERNKLKIALAGDKPKPTLLEKAGAVGEALSFPFETTGRGIRQRFNELTGDTADVTAIQQQQLQAEQNLAKAQEIAPIGVPVARAVGSIAQAIPTATLGAGAPIIAGAATGAGLEALQPTQPGENLGVNVALAGAVGAAFGAAAKVGTSIYRAFTKSGGARAALEGIDDAAVKASEKAQQVGVKLTPAEASGSKAAVMKESRIATRARVPATVEESILQRNADIRDSFTGLVKQLTPEGTEAAVQKADDLFNAVSGRQITPEVNQDLMKNSVINLAARKAAANPKFADEWASLPENSVGRWQIIKRQIDDLRGTNVMKGAADTRAFDKASDVLRKTVGKEHPEYLEALGVSQRVILQRNLFDRLSKIKGSEITGEVTPSQLYKEFFGSKETFDNLIKDFSSVPELLPQIKNLRSGLQKVGISRLDKIVTAPDELSSISGFQSLKNLGKETIRKRFYTGYMEMITNPKWADDLKKIKQADSRLTATRLFTDLMNTITRESGATSNASEKASEIAPSITGNR